MSKRVSVADAAIAAHEAEQVAEAARRAEIAQLRAAEDALKDATTLEWVKDHPWIRRYLPDAKWHLVDRRFPQETAVVSPLGEVDNIKIIVTRTNHDYIHLTVPHRRNRDGWLVGATLCRTLADLGREIEGRRRKARAESDEA